MNYQKIAQQAENTLKQSSSDWLTYVKNHPIQTMIYGIVIYFSMKGIFNKN